VLQCWRDLRKEKKTVFKLGAIRLFRIMSIPTTFLLFLVLTSEQIGRRFSVKDRYQLNYFICIKDFNAETNTFFICGCQHHQRKMICLYVDISDIRQIVGYLTPVFIQRFPRHKSIGVFVVYIDTGSSMPISPNHNYSAILATLQITSKFCYFRPPDHVILMD
jgi:hypothetical protein